MASLERDVLEKMGEDIKKNPGRAAEAILSFAYSESAGANSLTATVEALRTTVSTLQKTVDKLSDKMVETTTKADENADDVKVILQKLQELDNERKESAQKYTNQLEQENKELRQPNKYKIAFNMAIIGALATGIVAQVIYVFFNFNK